jgi:homoaconitase/3-isopropylmalate dehydratase large subunit
MALGRYPIQEIPDRVFIGFCTNARIGFAAAAVIEAKVANGVRALVAPVRRR